MLRGLLHAGADPDLVDSSGRCAMHWATLANRPDCLQVLLDANAERAVKDVDGRTLGLGVVRDVDGRTALLLAASRGA